MNIKRIVTLLFALVFILSSSACTQAPTTSQAATSASEQSSSAASTGTEPSETPDEPLLVGISTCNASSGFQTRIIEASKAEVLRRGGKYIVYDANLDQAKQLADIEDMIQKKCNVIIIEAVDSTGFIPAVKSAKAAGIPVITQNVFPTKELTDIVNGMTYGDVYQGGVILGEAQGKAMGGKGKLLCYNYSLVDVCKEFYRGFLDGLKKYPDVEIPINEDGDPDSNKAMTVAEGWMQTHPDVGGFYAFCDQASYGISAAVASAGKSKQVQVCFAGGGTLEDFQKIKDGVLSCVSVSPTYEMGVIGVDLAYQAYKAGVNTRLEDVMCPQPTATIENVDQFIEEYHQKYD